MNIHKLMHIHVSSGSVSPSNDAWDLGAMNSSLPKDRSTTKSPADFLGENANLVNLDNLVSRPAVDSEYLILLSGTVFTVKHSLNSVVVINLLNFCLLIMNDDLTLK